MNRLILDGQVLRLDPPRQSPAGLPIVRFVLEHRSRQHEAGHERDAQLRIVTVAAGETLARNMRRIKAGSEIRVRGFLARANTRSGESRLVLHANQVELLGGPGPDANTVQPAAEPT